MSPSLRIVLAGIVGGVLVFFVGFFEHEYLKWGGRTITAMPDVTTFREFVREKKLPPAFYAFPAMQTDDSPEERKRLSEEWKAGPSGFLIIAPSGEEPVSGVTLGLEVLTNIIAAWIAAWIVSLISAEKGFLWRWKVVVLMAIFGWISLTASYGIWYRFPWPFIRDDLLCTILEWCIGGAAIAGIVKRRAQTASKKDAAKTESTEKAKDAVTPDK